MTYQRAGSNSYGFSAFGLRSLFYIRLECYLWDEGILLPFVFEFNSEAVQENKILRLAEVRGLSAKNKLEAVEKIVTLIKKLTADAEIPNGLKKMVVLESDLDALAPNALEDRAGLTNPRKGTLEDMINIYKRQCN